VSSNNFSGTVARPSVKRKTVVCRCQRTLYCTLTYPWRSLCYWYHWSNNKIFSTILCKTKSDVHKWLKLWYEEYIIPIRQTNTQSQDLQYIFLNTDMGECTSNATISFLKEVGIELTTTCPYTPEQNMVIEWVSSTIGESTIAMLLTSSLSEIFWEEARNTACFLYNRSPGAHKAIHPTSPYKQYYGIQPHVLHFKVFGSKCYSTWLDRLKGNHTPKAEVGILVGYRSSSYGVG